MIGIKIDGIDTDFMTEYEASIKTKIMAYEIYRRVLKQKYYTI